MEKRIFIRHAYQEIINKVLQLRNPRSTRRIVALDMRITGTVESLKFQVGQHTLTSIMTELDGESMVINRMVVPCQGLAILQPTRKGLTEKEYGEYNISQFISAAVKHLATLEDLDDRLDVLENLK